MRACCWKGGREYKKLVTAVRGSVRGLQNLNPFRRLRTEERAPKQTVDWERAWGALGEHSLGLARLLSEWVPPGQDPQCLAGIRLTPAAACG